VRQILGTLLTGRAADVTRLRCLALAMPAAKGVARPHLILDSEYSTLVGTGTVDLGREVLDLTLVPHARAVDLNVALPVTVRGPLTGPSFGLDEADAARRIASLVGAAVFPPAIIGAFADLGSAPANPCLKLAADPGGLPGSATNLPTQLLREPDKATDAAKEALGQAKKAGKGLLQDLLRGR
jgi:AsmA protein